MPTIQSADNPISPGGGSGSNISLPSFSNYSPERQKQLSNSYVMGYHRAAAKYKVAMGKAMIPFICPLEKRDILDPEGGTGLPKEEEVDVVSGGEVVVQGKYVL